MHHLEKSNEQRANELSELLRRIIELEVACGKLIQANNEYNLSAEEVKKEKNRLNNLVQTIDVLIASIRRLLISSKGCISV